MISGYAAITGKKLENASVLDYGCGWGRLIRVLYKFVFSVFSHLSEKTTGTVLKTLKKYIAPDGLLVIAIRPKEYWQLHKEGILAPR